MNPVPLKNKAQLYRDIRFRNAIIGLQKEIIEMFVCPYIVTNFFIVKPTRCTNFTNLFWHETLHVSDSSSVHHQEFIHCTLSNVICHTAFEQDQDGTAVPSRSCSKAAYKPL